MKNLDRKQETIIFADLICQFVGDELVEKIIISPDYCAGPNELRLVDWSEARPFLEFQIRLVDRFSDGVVTWSGTIPICVWTPTRIIFVQSYDGMDQLVSIPRNPTEYNPVTIGGG